MHASCVSHGGRGGLIIGASGSGKSGLALQLIALGATLVADDRTCLIRDGNRITARAPAPLTGLIEARGLGILRAPAADQADVALVIDMDQTETARLPGPHQAEILGQTLPCLRKCGFAHFPAAILLYLQHGRHA